MYTICKYMIWIIICVIKVVVVVVVVGSYCKSWKLKTPTTLFAHQDSDISATAKVQGPHVIFQLWGRLRIPVGTQESQRNTKNKRFFWGKIERKSTWAQNDVKSKWKKSLEVIIFADLYVLCFDFGVSTNEIFAVSHPPRPQLPPKIRENTKANLAASMNSQM